jgi:hypothetical protein
MGSNCLFSKVKIFSMFLLLLFIGGMLAGAGVAYHSSTSLPLNVDKKNENIHDLRVALYAEDIILSSGFDLFMTILNNYNWQVGDTMYRFVVSPLRDSDIYKGRLDIKNFDIFIMPGGGGGGYATITKAYTNIPRVHQWRQHIIDFIKNGGGFVAICGGTYFFLGLDRKPKTAFEYYLNRSGLNVSAVKLNFLSYANPIFNQWLGYPPESIGHAAYLYYTGWNQTGGPIFSGIPLDVSLNRSHPVFRDYLTNTTRVRWISGPAYSISEHPDRIVSAVAWFPAQEISDNQSVRIHAWDYTSKIHGFLPDFFSYFAQGQNLLMGFVNVYTHATDWKKTSVIIQTNFSGKPFMTAEVYPNDNQARIFLCSGHPEYHVWWGGSIQEANDTTNNCLYDSLYRWAGMIPENQTLEDEATFTWWILRRSVAWAAKLPDTHLPPIYGASQVADIVPYSQPLLFNLTGVAEHTTGELSLDLYYRYSRDTSSWGPWVFYATDDNYADGWHWKFDASQTCGVGLYQFYSLCHVHQMYQWINETAPPGPDAIAHVH